MLPDNDATRWLKPASPDGGPSRMDILRQRHIIRGALRSYLDGQGFIEIDAPLLVHGASPDISIDSFKVGDLYLVSSTEYQMKRLAIGGFTQIYSLTKNFRRGDLTSFRNPEFSMLEWGRVGSDMRQIENDAEYMLADALDGLNISPRIDYQGKKIDLTYPWDRVPVLEAIERVTGSPMRDFSAASCRRAIEKAGLEVRPDWAEHEDFLFSLLMDHIQPRLGDDKPVFLTEWPFYETTSAGADPSDPSLARRSELFIGGLEIADGFAGLVDAAIQEQLFKAALARRAQEGKDSVDLDERYLAAMKDCSAYGAGMALGFDRLVMLLTNQSEIKNVLAFAWDEV